MKNLNFFLIIFCFTLIPGCSLFDTGSSRYNGTNSNLTTNTNQVEAPTFSPSEGAYASTQSVTISSATDGAEIHYTTDGTDPTCSSGTTYTAAISVSATKTIKAIACKDSMNDSEIVSATYTIGGGNTTTVYTPTFNHGTGSYNTSLSIIISTATAGATIHYTTDGSTTPTCSSTTYISPINVSSNETIEAIGCKTGLTNSSIATAVYTINSGSNTVATPTFSPAGTNYSTPQSVTISDTTSGASIHYTFNDSPTTPPNDPNCASTTYSAPISVGAGVTKSIKAVACTSAGYTSSISSATYIIAPNGNNCGTLYQTCCPTPPSVPSLIGCTDSTTQYCDTNHTCQLRLEDGYPCTNAIQCLIGVCIDDLYGTKRCNSEGYDAATPTFVPGSGTQTSTPVSVTMTSNAGTTIHYTTSTTATLSCSSTPTTPSGTPVSITIPPSTGVTVRAIACGSNYNPSSQGSATYTLQGSCGGISQPCCGSGSLPREAGCTSAPAGNACHPGQGTYPCYCGNAGNCIMKHPGGWHGCQYQDPETLDYFECQSGLCAVTTQICQNNI